MSQTSVVVIGGGPGGYVAAIRAAQLGASVTLVEKKHVGGTCLNEGCIPTKALLRPAELVHNAREAAALGVHLTVDSVCWPETLAYKNSVVKKLTAGVSGLLKGGQVRVIDGAASFMKPKTIEIEKADGSHELLEADRFIIATGSVPAMPAIEGLAESKNVLDSTGVLSMEALPQSIIVLGGGVIGIELACALNAFGCAVTVVEEAARVIPGFERDLAVILSKQLKAQGIKLMTGYKTLSVQDNAEGVSVRADHGGEVTELQGEKVLCAVSRRPYIDGLRAEEAGIRCAEGKILVNENLETSIPGVYAIGDCLGQNMLAHTASAQGEIAAENALGAQKKYRSECVPSCIYCFPEVASVGLTEEQAKEQGIAFHTGRFPMAANGRALIANGGEGVVKVIIGDELDEVLGVHMVGPHATELIAEAALAISMEATAEEIIGTIHAHPTVSEAVREAVMSAQGCAIHAPNKKKKG